MQEGFVERTAGDRYRLSLKLYEIGQEVVSSRVLRQVGHVPLEKLHNDSNEATHLAVLSGPDVVYLDRLESPQMMGLFTRVGRRRSAHATSSGKVLLAYGSQADVDDAIAAGLPRLGPRTITTRTRLNQALAEVRKAGYAISTDEAAPGVVSIAAPIFDRLGACVASVSVAGPLIRMPEDRHDQLVRMVVRTAAEISRHWSTTRLRSADDRDTVERRRRHQTQPGRHAVDQRLAGAAQPAFATPLRSVVLCEEANGEQGRHVGPRREREVEAVDLEGHFLFEGLGHRLTVRGISLSSQALSRPSERQLGHSNSGR